jgi:hypothetical protein
LKKQCSLGGNGNNLRKREEQIKIQRNLDPQCPILKTNNSHLPDPPCFSRQKLISARKDKHKTTALDELIQNPRTGSFKDFQKV